MSSILNKKTDIQDEILITQCGKAGVITLNRPQSLNALNLSMIEKLTHILKQWKTDPEIEFVMVESNNPKAFCAGGDIRDVYRARLEEDYDFCDTLFRLEYQLNYLISSYPKPFLSLIDGICMGGGMGLSMHGKYRLVTDKAILAMPETAIGFFPDVGASFFLNQCPGKIGIFLGIVGDKISAADAIYTGLATHYIKTEELPLLKQNLLKLKKVEELEETINRACTTPPLSFLESHQDLINNSFKGNTVEEIVSCLEAINQPLTAGWLQLLDKRSPTSLKVSLKLLQDNQGKSLQDCLRVEFNLSQKFCKFYDFFEGVRALLIDKDQAPKWLVPHLSQVTKEQVGNFFNPLPLPPLSFHS